MKIQPQSIRYQNEINSYTIADFETDEEEFTVVGYLPFINSGDTLKLIGKFVTHQDYGRQFKIDSFEKLMPQTLASLEQYLANGTIKGIGPATAKKIVDTFGEETIHIFKYEPEKLASIKGITKDKALEMAESFNENWELWQIVGFLERFGIGASNAKKVYKLLGVDAISKIEELKREDYDNLQGTTTEYKDENGENKTNAPYKVTTEITRYVDSDYASNLSTEEKNSLQDVIKIVKVAVEYKVGKKSESIDISSVITKEY